MADVYVQVGQMAVESNAKKVPKEYAKNAKALMRTAAINAFKKASGYTPQKTGNPKNGFTFDGTLKSVTIDTAKKTASCEIVAIANTWPQLKTKAVKATNTSTINGTDKGDVEYCIKAGVAKTVKDIIPQFKNLK